VLQIPVPFAAPICYKRAPRHVEAKELGGSAVAIVHACVCACACVHVCRINM
jgi:hypothetical protein